ncbi:MAG: response regulator [Desulfobacteraceae bacterium]|nr:response regulator [Desulfobacteraceae bacterium]
MTRTLSDQYFHGIMDAVPDPIVVYNTEGRVMYLNRQFNEVFGWTLDEIIDQRLDFVPPHEVEKTQDAVLRTINGEVVMFETQRYDKSGNILDIQISASIFNEQNGERGGMIVAFRNISELKRAEVELIKAREEADLANRSKSDFLAKMSHEIRTPMNAIIGLTDLALRTEMTEKQNDYIEKVSWSAHSLLEIINDILDFSKIEAGKMALEKVNFSLEKTLSHLADLVTIKAGEKGIEINFQMDKKIPMGLKGDPLRLGQILLNLLNNAVKFTENGEIIVSAQVEEENDDIVKLLFIVEDTGIGLSHKQTDHLFESFNQADESTTRKYGGTGLGLTICKKLVEMMDGEIWVRSQLDVGSKFYFTAYFGRQSKQTLVNFPHLDELKGLNVLVVDDSKIARKIFEDYLTAMYFNVTLASSGKEGVKKVFESDSKKPYDLVIMDWKMPVMDGLEAAKMILDNNSLKHCPKIIMVSAFVREDIKLQVKKYKLDGFLLKPINPSILFDTVAMVYGKETNSQRNSDLSLSNDNDKIESIKGAHILLVEDNAINQQVAFEIMARRGLSVTIAGNGEEAVNMVKERSFDLVLMDIQMPVMDGYTATKKIENLSKKKNLPIVAMTAHAMAGDYDKSLKAGMKDHITKPINSQELFSTLLKWIDPKEIVRDTLEKNPKLQNDIKALGLLPESLPGFDIQNGLQRACNDESLYLRLLKLFKQDYTDCISKLNTALMDDDIDGARSLAHQVKGVSANLGAIPLFNAAEKLEASLNSDADNSYKDLVILFEVELNKAMASLEQIKVKKREKQDLIKDKTNGDGSEKLLEIIKEYKPFLKACKPKKCKNLIEEINSLKFPKELTQKIEILGNHLSRYEFKDGLKILKKIELKLENKEIQ